MSIFSYRAQLYAERYGFAATGNMAVRASVFGAVGPFGGIPSMEDTEWGQRATAQGFQVAYIPDAVVLTPSCKSFNELARRWDRHVAHEFRKVDGGVLSIARWLAGCAVVAASPLAEVIRIMRSDHIKGMCGRPLALMCLTRIRLYRAQRMPALALHRDAAAVMGKWNRESS